MTVSETFQSDRVFYARYTTILTITTIVILSLLLTIGVLAQTEVVHTVTSNANAGSGTLREALTNAGAGDTIVFSPSVFPPGTPATIFLTSELPMVAVNDLLLDASDAGVVLNGSGLPDTWNDCLIVSNASNVTISGLQIEQCPDHGIEVRGGTTNITIGGDRNIGSGLIGQGNRVTFNSRGIWVEFADGVTIKGNIVGANLAGSSAQSNRYSGITIVDSNNVVVGSNISGERNLVSGNGDPNEDYTYGLEIWRTDVITIKGNYIGTNLAGTMAVGNTQTGILVVDSNNVLLKDNLVSGNGTSGVIFDVKFICCFFLLKACQCH